MVLASVFVLAGCSDSPRDVAVKWANAIADGDSKKVAEYSTERSFFTNAGLLAEVHSSERNMRQFKEEFIKEKLKKGEVEIDGDSASIGGKLKLKKVDGKWKVDADRL